MPCRQFMTGYETAILIGDDHACLTHFTLASGAQSGWNDHKYRHALITTTDSPFLLKNRDGSEHMCMLPASLAFDRPAGLSHNEINIGDHTNNWLRDERKNSAETLPDNPSATISQPLPENTTPIRKSKTNIAEVMDTPQSWVCHFSAPPGAQTGWRHHNYDYVVSFATNCQIRYEHPDNSELDRTITAGTTHMHTAGLHQNIINTCKNVLVFIEADVKPISQYR